MNADCDEAVAAKVSRGAVRWNSSCPLQRWWGLRFMGIAARAGRAQFAATGGHCASAPRCRWLGAQGVRNSARVRKEDSSASSLLVPAQIENNDRRRLSLGFSSRFRPTWMFRRARFRRDQFRCGGEYCAGMVAQGSLEPRMVGLEGDRRAMNTLKLASIFAWGAPVLAAGPGRVSAKTRKCGLSN